MKMIFPVLLSVCLVAGCVATAPTDNSKETTSSKKGMSQKRMGEQARSLRGIGVAQTVDYNEDTQEIKLSMQILFDKDSDDLKSSEKKKLDKLAVTLAKYPENIVVIEGHTDSDGPADYNKRLSEKRAKSIKSYLKSKNLGISRLESVGYGEEKPIKPNDTPEGKTVNRRVEIKISTDVSRLP